MAEASTSLHEDSAQLSALTCDTHRALVSLQEELEAVDWYRQRAEACSDGELRAVLAHNMREEIEHAAMILEWLRRSDPDFDRHLSTYLFTNGPITEVEEAATGKDDTEQVGEAEQGGQPAAKPRLGLTLGSLKGDRS